MTQMGMSNISTRTATVSISATSIPRVSMSTTGTTTTGMTISVSRLPGSHNSIQTEGPTDKSGIFCQYSIVAL